MCCVTYNDEADIFIAFLFVISTDASCPASSILCRPSDQAMNKRAPEIFIVDFQTNLGVFSVDVYRAWAPVGADRFYNLVMNHFYDDCRFYRVLPSYIAQWGINGDPDISSVWDYLNNQPGVIIDNDPVKISNVRATVSFSSNLNSQGQSVNRTTEVFINLENNTKLDFLGYTPIGWVSSGMNVVDNLYGSYGELQEALCPSRNSPTGQAPCPGPSEQRIYSEGNAYLNREFPLLDYIIKAQLKGGSARQQSTKAHHGMSFMGYLLIVIGTCIGLFAIYALYKKYSSNLLKSRGPALLSKNDHHETDAVDLDFR